ncbi:protein phosphatase 2C domain-containing protein [Amycolatopsis sp. WAC 01416]|uniref:protein phosphatase 2C domain-containing protein n=1 Tax=Amycolatopsis sp. WAC 01416 TaxID=2203196 RepID=UPI0026784F2E
MTASPRDRLRLTVSKHTAVKYGRSEDENEDSVTVNKAAGRFAISDGASTAARPEVWSRVLTEAYATELLDPFDQAVLRELRHRWRHEVLKPDLPWFAQAKLAQGSAATFTGLQVSEFRFSVIAIGDSCLLHLRDGEMLFSAPLSNADEFSRFPVLVRTLDETPPAQEIWSGGGQHQAGDVFILATDAIAKYLIQNHIYLSLFCREPIVDAWFGDFVTEHRGQGLANDDTTVCVVRT